MKNINLKEIIKMLNINTKDIDIKYIDIEDLKNVKVWDIYQKDCSGISVEKPVWWSFANYTEKNVLGKWCDTWDEGYFIKDIRPTLNIEDMYSCTDYWTDPKSPFSPCLDNRYKYLEEGVKSMTFFSNKYFKNKAKDKFALYIEYAYTCNTRDIGDTRGELYLVNFNN